LVPYSINPIPAKSIRKKLNPMMSSALT